MTIKEYNDIVFEAMFRQAVIDNFNEELDYYEREAKLNPIEPSPEFEKRMRDLIDNAFREEAIIACDTSDVDAKPERELITV